MRRSVAIRLHETPTVLREMRKGGRPRKGSPSIRKILQGRETTLEQRARCRLAAVHAGDCARQTMDLMFRHGGSTSFKTASRLAEVWRA